MLSTLTAPLPADTELSDNPLAVNPRTCAACCLSTMTGCSVLLLIHTISTHMKAQKTLLLVYIPAGGGVPSLWGAIAGMRLTSVIPSIP